jgi:hypothetical protein
MLDINDGFDGNLLGVQFLYYNNSYQKSVGK